MSEPEHLLMVEGISCHFGGLAALSDVSVRAAQGRITGVIGPNGAGKTTLFNVVSGALRPTKGRVLFKGQRIDGRKPHQIARLGLARTFQIPQAFPTLTVGQTLRLALRHSTTGNKRYGDESDIAELVGLTDKLDALPSEITAADLHALEVAKVLAVAAELILLDEVFAGLTPTEIDRMVALIRQVRARGTTVLMIEHRMRAVMALCEEVYVLVFGRLIASGTPAEVTRHPEVVQAYLGSKARRDA
ncbi:MAG: ABC transporter ATP-binding protein [Candidatus Rokubacteria bacterium]|nr:ABC transporter ATP-binding protein [Candidatus Rokubacteria bacterium]